MHRIYTALSGKPVLVDLLIILALSMIVLNWFSGDAIIAKGDLSIPLRPDASFYQSLFMWNDHLSAGQSGPFVINLFPFHAFFIFFDWLGLTLAAIEKVWFVFIFFMIGLGMYYLVMSVVSEHYHRLAALFAAAFYMFNMYLVLLSPPTHSLILAYMMSPLILGFFIRGLREKEGSGKYVALIGVSSTLFISGIFNIPPFLIIALCYLIYHLITNRKLAGHSLRFTGCAIGVTILINLWWLYAFLPYFLHPGEQVATGAFIERPGGLRSENASFLELLRLSGHWAFYSSALGSKYYAFAEAYHSSPLLILATYVPPLLALLALLFQKTTRGVAWFFGFLAALGLFLAAGSHPPTGGVFMFLYDRVPGFWIFREPFKFIGITVLAYAVLIGIAVATISSKLKEIKPRIQPMKQGNHWLVTIPIILIIGACLMGSAWPMLTGAVIEPDRGALPSERVMIPEYWYQASDWLNRQEGEFRVFLLPQGFNYALYDWGYHGSDIAAELITKPLLGPAYGYYEQRKADDILDEVVLAIDKGENLEPDILEKLNIRYVMQRNDINWELMKITSAERVIESLELQPNLKLVRSFGPLLVYENTNWSPQYGVGASIGIKKAELVYNFQIEENHQRFTIQNDEPENQELVLTSVTFSGNTQNINPFSKKSAIDQWESTLYDSKSVRLYTASSGDKYLALDPMNIGGVEGYVTYKVSMPYIINELTVETYSFTDEPKTRQIKYLFSLDGETYEEFFTANTATWRCRRASLENVDASTVYLRLYLSDAVGQVNGPAITNLSVRTDADVKTVISPSISIADSHISLDNTKLRGDESITIYASGGGAVSYQDKSFHGLDIHAERSQSVARSKGQKNGYYVALNPMNEAGVEGYVIYKISLPLRMTTLSVSTYGFTNDPVARPIQYFYSRDDADYHVFFTSSLDDFRWRTGVVDNVGSSTVYIKIALSDTVGGHNGPVLQYLSIKAEFELPPMAPIVLKCGTNVIEYIDSEISSHQAGVTLNFESILRPPSAE